MRMLFLILWIQFAFPKVTFSQNSTLVEVNDIIGFQYKSFYQRNDTIHGVLYYSNKERAMYSICKIKTEKDIPKCIEIINANQEFLKKAIPKVRCGKRTFTFSFLYDNGKFNEIRIIYSDYVIKDYNKTCKRLNRLIQKMSIPLDDPMCIYLYEITYSIDAGCPLRKIKPIIKYN